MALPDLKTRRAGDLLGESRFMLSQGRLVVALEYARKSLAVDPDVALTHGVVATIEAALYWLAERRPADALREIHRIFDIGGLGRPVDLQESDLIGLQNDQGAVRREAALEGFARAHRLALSTDKTLAARVLQAARQLEPGWKPPAPPRPAPPPLITDCLCFLDRSIATTPDIVWTNDLPHCRLLMMADHGPGVTGPKGTRASNMLLATLAATHRFEQWDRPDDVGVNADLLLDQVWRQGTEYDLIIVTNDAVQAAGAQRLRDLGERLGFERKLAPVKKSLRILRAERGLPPWPEDLPLPARPKLAAAPVLPKHPLFGRPVSTQVHVNLTPLKVSTIKTGSVLATRSGDFRRMVSPRLGLGGEGFVFRTDVGDVCKVYKPKKASVATRRKLELMVAKNPGHPQVCWPTDIVLRKGQFAGYLMPAAQGSLLSETVTDAEGLVETFPTWTRLELARLALQICEIVDFLHSHNIILGDLSDTNVMVDREGVPWFIDTDSYQIGEFPSPVSRLPFAHPDLMQTDLRLSFRETEHDRFALATLVFMILFAGRKPYSGGGSESYDEDHRERVFPYRIQKEGDPRLDDRPRLTGAAPFIWSHLPPYVRKGFWAVFRFGKEKDAGLEPHEAPYDARFWRDTLAQYVRALESNKVSRELFPSGYRAPPPPKYGEQQRLCVLDERAFNAPQYSNQIYCPTCRNAMKTLPCVVPQCRLLVYKRFGDPRTGEPDICNFHKANPPA